MNASGRKMLINSTYGITGDKITRILANASTDLILNFKGEVENELNFPISGDEIARIKAKDKISFVRYCQLIHMYVSPKEKMRAARYELAFKSLSPLGESIRQYVTGATNRMKH